jgi:nucleoside-diphosphate-sugar epimerase
MISSVLLKDDVMRVFVTGATGFIGSAIVQELLTAGHEVLGLARSDASAERLARTGASVHRGELTDLDSLVAGARAGDGVIHTAFIHDDFTQFERNATVDRESIVAMADVMVGTDKPLVVTSGTALLAPGRVGTEADVSPPDSMVAHRAATEGVVLAYADRGVRVSIVRLPPTVHGAGDHGFVPAMIGMDRKAGFAAYIGDGSNRWPAVHRLDAAHLYRLALEGAEPGTRLHAVAEEGIPMRTIAETIGQGLDLPVRSISQEEAATHFTWLAGFVGLDVPASSAVTRETFGWEPGQPDLLTDIRENGYVA